MKIKIKKCVLILISILMLVLISCGKNELKSPLTLDQKIEDFDFLYSTIKENYPFLAVNERITGENWLGNREEYIELIKEINSDMDFLYALDLILSDLNSGHTHVLDKYTYEEFLDIYDEDYSWPDKLQRKVLNNSTAKRRYKVTEDLYNYGNRDIVEKGYNKRNVIAKDIIEGDIGYISINDMLLLKDMDEDKKIIEPYLENIKDYEVLVLDIRNNTGGDERYWAEYLLPKIIDKTYSTTHYYFWKDGKEIKKFFKACKFTPDKVAELKENELPNLPPEIFKDFKYYSDSNITIEPKESIKFKGNIYLLTNKEVYSAAESMAIFCKDTGLATLIGGITGGDGVGTDPLLAMLPNSGYIFRYPKDFGTTSNGTCNEEFKTIPNYVVDDTKQYYDFQKDSCIQKVLELEEKK